MGQYCWSRARESLVVRTLSNMGNGTTSGYPIGITSWTYHISMWILVTAGILGNALVIVWRFSRRESRLNILSVLIVSLAMADLCFCLHFLLQEVMLADPIFNSRNRSLFNVTSTDERLCLSIKFFVGVSVNASTLTAVAIALYTFCSFCHCRHGNRLITGFILISWIACLVSGAVATWQFKKYYTSPETAVDVETLWLLAIFGCVDSDLRYPGAYYGTIVVTMNAVSSLVVSVLYLCLWLKIRKSAFSSSRQCGDKEVNHFRIRLIVISLLNLLCWWPACIMYLFSVANNESAYDGLDAHGRHLSPVVTEPAIILTAAVSVANPIIYTIASKWFFRRVCRAWLVCSCRKDRLIILPANLMKENNETVDGGCCAVCRRWFSSQKTSGIRIRNVESCAEVTEESSLFTESE